MLTVRVCVTLQPCWSFLLQQSHINTKGVSSPEKSAENNINPCATKTVCKHFFMLIISNMRANVKLIYPSCVEKWGKETSPLLWLHIFLRSTCFSVSLTARNSKTVGSLHAFCKHLLSGVLLESFQVKIRKQRWGVTFGGHRLHEAGLWPLWRWRMCAVGRSFAHGWG